MIKSTLNVTVKQQDSAMLVDPVVVVMILILLTALMIAAVVRWSWLLEVREGRVFCVVPGTTPSPSHAA